MTDKPLLTIDEVAEYLGVPRQRLYSWRHAGKGPPAIQLEGRLLRYRQADLDSWLDSQRENGGPVKAPAPSTPAWQQKAAHE